MQAQKGKDNNVGLELIVRRAVKITRGKMLEEDFTNTYTHMYTHII